MRINMCAAIIVMQCVFLIGAHVKAQQVMFFFVSCVKYKCIIKQVDAAWPWIRAPDF